MTGVGGTFFKREPGEEMIRVVRHHWFVFFVTALKYIGVGLIPLAIIFLADFFSPGLFDVFNEGDLARPALILGASLVYLTLWLFLFGEWVDFYLDVWILTNHRIIDVTQDGLFGRKVSQLHLSRVQDITVNIHGILATMFRYGDLQVQSAGEQEKFLIEGISNPNELVKELNRLALECKNI